MDLTQMSVAKAEAHVWEFTRGADICRIYAIDGHAKSDQHGRRYRRVGRGAVRAISRQAFLTRRRFADSTLWNFDERVCWPVVRSGHSRRCNSEALTPV